MVVCRYARASCSPLALTACDSFRDLFSAHADVAAEAGQQKLTPERLAQILSSGKGIKPNREAANFVSNVWVDYALFAQAVANGKLPLDSAGIAQAVWPELAELQGQPLARHADGAPVEVPPHAADSVYRGDQVRVLQHILFRVPPNAVPEVRNAARKKAEGTLARVKRGADFGQLARPSSRKIRAARRTRLPAAQSQGQVRAAFDSAGWTLAPGATSGVVETPFGYHIIKRPDRRCGPRAADRVPGPERRQPARLDLYGQPGDHQTRSRSPRARRPPCGRPAKIPMRPGAPTRRW